MLVDVKPAYEYYNHELLFTLLINIFIVYHLTSVIIVVEGISSGAYMQGIVIKVHMHESHNMLWNYKSRK